MVRRVAIRRVVVRRAAIRVAVRKPIRVVVRKAIRSSVARKTTAVASSATSTSVVHVLTIAAMVVRAGLAVTTAVRVVMIREPRAPISMHRPLGVPTSRRAMRRVVSSRLATTVPAVTIAVRAATIEGRVQTTGARKRRRQAMASRGL